MKRNRKKKEKFELVVQLAVVVFLFLIILSVLWWDGNRKTAIAKKVAKQHIVFVK